ncbi:DUSAM domain-containing protein [Pyxidicoccus parkwayensis]|jgi:DUSAM domain-containing protein|uniref:DUSAM domain-containing protein n=1 Tax=Pyxidicoccus parkwayensis TaxID=2813578 RepID=A0ABX7P2W0_9BACT|nr:DUSAM domain-containing protein [Pyxidicoccus parkwaysis]QSQ24797.1 DUSAM domain-containing protein [Pyxidicoccus parkwaysis]
MSKEIDWDPFRALAQRVLRHGAPLELTDDVRTLLSRTAREVAISDAESALKTNAGALELLSECSRRIQDGSWRLMRALNQMYRHQKTGDFDSARQEMRNVLAVEVVPLYREIAQEQLDDMADEP